MTMIINHDEAEILDLALELLFTGPCETFSDALNVARSVLPSQQAYVFDYDRSVADAAALAGDAETCYAASPF
jgi:hypothetical protein